MGIKRYVNITLAIVGLSLGTLVAPVQADEVSWFDRFGLSVGGSYAGGTMANSGMGLPSRTMTVGSFEGLLFLQSFR